MKNLATSLKLIFLIGAFGATVIPPLAKAFPGEELAACGPNCPGGTHVCVGAGGEICGIKDHDAE